jgi:MFS family permease
MQEEPAQKLQAYAVFAYPAFRFFLLTRFLATIAIQIQAVVVGWKVYEITKDPLSLGFIGLVEAIPAISVALFAGYVVDKQDRRNVSAIALLLLLLCSVALFVFSLYPSSNLVFVIYVIIFISGLARGTMAPAMFALMSQLVPRELYTNSSTWNSSAWQIGAVAGPAIGGLLYGWAGIHVTLGTVVVLMLVSTLFLLAIKPQGIPATAGKEDIFTSLKQGIGFVFKNKIILGALSLDLFAVLFGGAVALLPVFAKDVLLVGPEGLGILRAAPSVGAFTTMLVMAYYPPTRNAGRKLMFCVAGFGLCMIAFAFSKIFILSVAILALSGAFDSVSVIIRSTILQLMTPENMRGRVSAVNTMFIGSSNEIGAFESGVAARLLGLIPSVIFGGCMTLFVVATTYWKAPTLKGFSMNK